MRNSKIISALVGALLALPLMARASDNSFGSTKGVSNVASQASGITTGSTVCQAGADKSVMFTDGTAINCSDPTFKYDKTLKTVSADIFDGGSSGPGSIQITPGTLASLGAPSDGTISYCSDCTAGSNPCTTGGGGAFANRQGAAWVCGAGSVGGLTSGTTTITGGTDTAVCYDAVGVIKCDATSPLWTPGTRTLAIGTTSTATGKINLLGNTSGTVTIQPHDTAGTYNFNLPSSAGTSGQPLLSGGGASASQTYGTLSVGAGGTGITTLASNVLPKGAGASPFVASSLSDDGTTVSTTETASVGSFVFSGSEKATGVTTQTGTTYTVGSTDRFIRCNHGTGLTVTLPAATATGRIITFKLINATGTCTLDGSGAETIDGAATRVLTTQYQAVDLVDSASGAWDVRAAEGATFNPLDEDLAWFREDFMGGTTANPDVGDMEWQGRGGGGTLLANGSYPHLGIIELQTTSTINTERAQLLQDTLARPLSDIAQRANWEIKFQFKLSSTAAELMRLGVCDLWDTGHCPDDGVFVRYDTVAGDTNFMLQSCAAVTCSTAASLGVAADTSWHTARIYSTSAGTVSAQIDSGTPASVTTNLPTITLTPIFHIKTTEAVDKRIQVDFVFFKATVAR